MKKFFLLLSLFLISVFNTLSAQTAKELIASGNKVFIEVKDLKSEDHAEGYEAFKKYLLSKEWDRWELVDSKEEANFVCRLTIARKGVDPFRSFGVRIQVVTEIQTIDGVSVWRSKMQTGNATELTGFNSMNDAMRKAIRRSITKELYGENVKDKK